MAQPSCGLGCYPGHDCANDPVVLRDGDVLHRTLLVRFDEEEGTASETVIEAHVERAGTVVTPGDEQRCLCTQLASATPWEPAEWEQADDCPVHPLAALPAPDALSEVESQIVDGALSNFIDYCREDGGETFDPQYGVDARHIRDGLRRGDLAIVRPAPAPDVPETPGRATYLSKGHIHDDPNWHMACAACNGKAEGEDDYAGDNGSTLADAWDEGHSAGEMDRHAPPEKYPTPNPYREVSK